MNNPDTYDPNKCPVCEAPTVAVEYAYFPPPFDEETYFIVECTQCTHTQGVDWTEDQIKKIGILNIKIIDRNE